METVTNRKLLIDFLILYSHHPPQVGGDVITDNLCNREVYLTPVKTMLKMFANCESVDI